MPESSNKNHRPDHLLFIMVDGLGIPPGSLKDSIYAGCPAIRRCIGELSTPLDATLGLPGAPQSATGQTALFTGVNAAQLLGRHLSGFPNAQLRAVVERENVFHRLRNRGLKVTFANAYARHTEQTLPKAFRSVTTVVTLSALKKTRTKEDMLAGRAVYHDLTRHWLREHGRVDAPLITEEEAADHLLAIARTVDFCLFEYFLTDHAAHRGDAAQKQNVLQSLDRLFAQLLEQINPQRELFVWTSDHGNIEDPSTTRHTRNPVPFCTYGKNSEAARTKLASIQQVSPRLEHILADPGKRPAERLPPCLISSNCTSDGV